MALFSPGRETRHAPTLSPPPIRPLTSIRGPAFIISWQAQRFWNSSLQASRQGVKNNNIVWPLYLFSLFTLMSSFLFAAVALGVGLLVGGFIGSRRYRRMLEEYQLLVVNNGAFDAVRGLEFLRSGDTAKAISHLEFGLDASLCQLGVMLRPPQRTRPDPGCLSALRKARVYRDKFPRTRSPDIDAAVARALALAGDP
jgi:hypothetical protein